jgi:hypothetical protein
MNRREFATWKVRIRHNVSGHIIEHQDDYGWADGNPFMYKDGNYSCDCNRSLFFWRAMDGVTEKQVECLESECGDTAFTVLSIHDPAGILIYEEKP